MSLTLVDARARSQVVSGAAYQIHLDLTGDEHFLATTTVTFAAPPGTSTFLDLQRALDVEVELNGRPLGPRCYRDDQVHLTDLAAHNTAVVTARMPYVTDGDGMHRFVDPSDGAVYLGCYGGMDVNRRVFACFDQPDLKAPVTVAVRARPGATVLSNGRPEQVPDVTDGGAPTSWVFATTPPLSTYLVTVCAGPWASRTWEHDGRPFGWHARASLAADLDRDLPMLREQTVSAYDWYAQRFDEPYPFDSYDQIFVPGHNWGAMENPGCVSYRDELLPQGTTPAVLARQRAMTIAHEMAHMWFGDLVTFRWWEDTWLNESFADYLGFVVAGATGAAPGALAEFDLGRKAGGYAADARPSTHPVAPRPEDVPDVDSAFNNFDPISYAKGNSTLRQLAFWLGEETFFAGVNRHLTGARFGTASLDDFVASLQSVTDRDVTGWVEAWLRVPGTDVLQLTRPGAEAGVGGAGARGREGLTLRLVPGVDERSGSSAAARRPHRVRVSGYAVSGDQVERAWEQVVDLSPGQAMVRLAPADLVVPNSTGDTFARIALDSGTLDRVLQVLGRVPDEHRRVILWSALLELAARGEITPAVLVRAVEHHLPGEGTDFVVAHVLSRSAAVVRQVTPAGEVGELLERLGQVALVLLGAAQVATAVAQTAVSVGAGALHDVDLLLGWLEVGAGHGPLSQEERWEVLRRLAELGADTTQLLTAEQERDPSAAGQLAALAVAAARPEPSTKAQALARMADDAVSNREIGALARGLWSAEQRDLVDPLVADYLRTMAPVARRGQALGLVVGRAAPGFRWTLAQQADLERALGEDTLPPVLARTWADVLHDQRRLGG
ncbi:aminopeptidase N [Ornithinimicrobium pratense]|uniref:Aminopeptidase N n=1 Tax=Ornithinimicrobium pratense TaxID=2593973 RepID=A0A5J6V4P9_9MICO|nr:aminopeptidase N [Ornithinimicrobium pratense]QFG68755.1 aminopeptidase N [Ornithinimicrobium pratense]